MTRRHALCEVKSLEGADPNGEFEVEPMYVRYTRLASPRARYPRLMWHGGGLTGVTYESTPMAATAG